VNKVIAVIPTADGKVLGQCLEALRNQTHPCEIMIETLAPESFSDSPGRNKSHNSTRTRNVAREKLLGADCDYVLWVDSDSVLPRHAVAEFLKQPQFQVQAGWGQMRASTSWNAGRWVGDNLFFHFTEVQPSLVRADYAGLGCLFMKKEILTIPFTSGLDKTCKAADGKMHYLGPCVAFGNSLFEKGIPIYMNGSVVCRHLTDEAVQTSSSHYGWNTTPEAAR